jgi:RNA polymerase sigma-70 factor, ECF subfamily
MIGSPHPSQEAHVTTMAPETLVRWCQQTLPDDSRAFEVLVSQYKRRVYSIAYRMMGSPQDAEDVAQEAFLNIYRGIKRLEEPATLGAWITRITVNTSLNALDRRRRRGQTQPLIPPDHEEEELPDRSMPTPEEHAERSEVRQCIERTLARMEPEARAAIILRDVEDRPYQEIADMLSLGLSAIKMRIHRARLSFQKLLETVCPGLQERYR